MTVAAVHTELTDATDQSLAQLLDAAVDAANLIVIDCEPCGRYGEPMSAAEAAAVNYVGIHDDFHHRGDPTAVLRPYHQV